jgi:hypothetical protein
MSEPVYKKLQVVGTSTTSFSDAAAKAIAKLGESEKRASWFEVVEQRGSVVEGLIQQYQVTLNVGIRIA